MRVNQYTDNHGFFQSKTVLNTIGMCNHKNMFFKKNYAHFFCKYAIEDNQVAFN